MSTGSARKICPHAVARFIADGTCTYNSMCSMTVNNVTNFIKVIKFDFNIAAYRFNEHKWS